MSFSWVDSSRRIPPRYGRKSLRDSLLVYLDDETCCPRFASDLGVEIKVANQIEWGITGRKGTAKKINW